MKINHVTTTLRGVRCVKFKATIGPSKKLAIKRHQKTWTFETCAPDFTTEQMQASIQKDAERWQARILKKYENKENAAPLAAHQQTMGLPDLEEQEPSGASDGLEEI